MSTAHTLLTALGLLLSWRNILISTLLTGCFLWLLINARRCFPPFMGVLFTLCCLFGSTIPLSLLQLLFPPLDSLFGTLMPLLMLATGGLIGTLRLRRAKYCEETQSLGFLLFALIVLLLVFLLVRFLPQVGYRGMFTFCTTGALTWALAIIPYWYLRRYVIGRLSHALMPAPIQVSNQSYAMAKRLAATCAFVGVVGLVVLWRVGQLEHLIASLPAVSAFFAWFLIMDVFGCWVTNARPRPSYRAAS